MRPFVKNVDAFKGEISLRSHCPGRCLGPALSKRPFHVCADRSCAAPDSFLAGGAAGDQMRARTGRCIPQHNNLGLNRKFPARTTQDTLAKLAGSTGAECRQSWDPES